MVSAPVAARAWRHCGKPPRAGGPSRTPPPARLPNRVHGGRHPGGRPPPRCHGGGATAIWHSGGRPVLPGRGGGSYPSDTRRHSPPPLGTPPDDSPPPPPPPPPTLASTATAADRGPAAAPPHRACQWRYPPLHCGVRHHRRHCIGRGGGPVANARGGGVPQSADCHADPPPGSGDGGECRQMRECAVGGGWRRSCRKRGPRGHPAHPPVTSPNEGGGVGLRQEGPRLLVPWPGGRACGP